MLLADRGARHVGGRTIAAERGDGHLHNSSTKPDSARPLSSHRVVRPDRRARIRRDALAAELQAAQARAQDLMWDKVTLLQRQFLLAEEFDRRLADSLTLIASVLSMQSRAAATPEAAIQLNTAPTASPLSLASITASISSTTATPPPALPDSTASSSARSIVCPLCPTEPCGIIPCSVVAGCSRRRPLPHDNRGDPIMSSSGSQHRPSFPYAPPGARAGDVLGDTRDDTRIDALRTHLAAALAREQDLLREKEELLRRQGVLAQEFEHRLANSLQMIASLLSLQSRSATPEAAAQLAIAARRVAALGRVHRQLHLLDHQEHVEFREYLQRLCGDLSGLLFEERPGSAIAVEGAAAEIATRVAIPLGFIVNELVTNSAKHANGRITVRLTTPTPRTYVLSVADDGPGLPAGFDPAAGKGLGMTIVRSLVRDIGGELQIGAGDDGRGACFTVTFGAAKAGAR